MNLEEWVKKLQSADEPTKSRWLFIGSVCAMIIVVGLWLLYMTSIVRPTTTPEENVQAQAVIQDNNQPSLLARVASLIGETFRDIGQGLVAFVKGINLSHSVIIKP